MYRSDWHSEHHEKTIYSARRILEILLKILPVKSVLDVGCGHGDWLQVALDLGVEQVSGCDGPWTNINELLIPHESFRSVDMRKPFRLGQKFDLALCLEVAEHLAEEHAADFVDSIVAHADLVFFGAAIPYQGGYRHVNEQWPSWWKRLFADKGFQRFDPVRRAVWDDSSVHFWYKQNALLYVRESRSDIIKTIREFEFESGGSMPDDIVHPDKYLLTASYKDIAFKPLLRAFPKAVYGKMNSMMTRP